MRPVHLNQMLLEILMNKSQSTENIDHDYVVTNDRGNPINPNYLTDCFHRHLIKHNLKVVRFHDLHHSFASLANEAGVIMNDISSTMGHSNIGVTSSIYTHEFTRKKSNVVDAVAMSIENAKRQEIPTQ